MPSHESERIHGTSNLSAVRDGTRVLRTIMRERMRRSPEAGDGWRPQYDELGAARERLAHAHQPIEMSVDPAQALTEEAKVVGA